MDNILLTIGSLLGGGTLTAVITALVNKKKVDAEAKNDHINSLLTLDNRVNSKMNERILNLEERMAKLEHENYDLKEKLLEKHKEIFTLKTRLEIIEQENSKLKSQLNGIKKRS